MKTPATGKGLAIKAVDAGGQADASGKVKPDQVVTHVNGTDVTEMSMEEMAPIIKSLPTTKFTLAASVDGGIAAAVGALATAVLVPTMQTLKNFVALLEVCFLPLSFFV